MRRKIIQNYVDVLCQMAIGWRLTDDLETLAELPDGVIEIDLRALTAVHSTTGKVDLCLTGELAAWLRGRFATDRIQEDQILRAELRLKSTTDRIKTDKKRIVSFDWVCHSLIATERMLYESDLKAHRWYDRM